MTNSTSADRKDVSKPISLVEAIAEALARPGTPSQAAPAIDPRTAKPVVQKFAVKMTEREFQEALARRAWRDGAKPTATTPATKKPSRHPSDMTDAELAEAMRSHAWRG